MVATFLQNLKTWCAMRLKVLILTGAVCSAWATAVSANGFDELQALTKGGVQPPACPVAISGDASPIADVRAAIALAKTLKRGEYETSSEFSLRLASQMGNMPPLRLEVPVYQHDGQYDPDKGVLHLSSIDLTLELDSFSVRGKGTWDGRYQGFKLKDATKNQGSYVGQNAFGAEAKVSRVGFDREEVAFSDFVSTMEGHTAGGLTMPVEWNVSLSLPPTKAQSVRPNLMFMVQGNLAEPFFVTDDRYSPATIDTPVDGTFHTVAAIMRPQCEAVVNKATGEVLASFAVPTE